MASRSAVWDLLLCYACCRLLTPRPQPVVYAQPPPGYTYARVGDAVSASATGGALSDLPLIACATMSRDEKSGPDSAASIELVSDRV